MQSIAANSDPLKSRLRPSDTLTQGAAHRFLGDRTTQQTFNRQMDVCGSHDAICKNLDDGSLYDAIAEPARLERRRRTLNRLQRLIRQRLEHGFQGCGGVCTVS